MNTQITLIRMSIFAGVLICMMLLEFFIPCRQLSEKRRIRWLNNLGLASLNSLLLRLIAPAFPAAAAVFAQQNNWGALTLLGLSPALKIALGLFALDLIIYLQHVMFHAIPLFWRFHKVHHADLDIDTTTGIRFHPLEMIISMGIKTAAVALIGPTPGTVIMFEIILNASSLFNHGNIQLPHAVDRALRTIIVTPDMHRIHHSVVVRETNSNYGFSISLWDRLMGTYRKEPLEGHQGMTIGLSQYRDQSKLTFFRLIILPFFLKTGREK